MKWRIFKELEENCIGIFLVIMLISVFVQIVSRYILLSPLSWTEELSRFSYVWLTFIGVGFGIKHIDHITMTLFIDKLPVHLQHILRLIVNVLIVAMLIYILPSNTLFAMRVTRVSSALEIPMPFVYMGVIIGLTIAGIRLIADSLICIRDYKLNNKAKKERHKNGDI